MEKHQSSKSALKATSMERLLKIRQDFIKERFEIKSQQEHYFEVVAKINGVTYINNSASTDVDSAWLALEKVNGNIIWIAGGVDRGNDYTMLQELVNDKVQHIICLGKLITNLYKAFGNLACKTIITTLSTDEAVHHASLLAKAGDTVLFSPACASYDLFEGIEDRGHQFKQSIHRLQSGELFEKYPLYQIK